jgi:two-component system nitrate/nitrite response regulator NarL
MYLVATASTEFETHARSIPEVTDFWLSVRDYPALLEALRHVQPSIVLLDMDLPGMPRGAQLAAFRRFSRVSRMIAVYRKVDEPREIDFLRHGGFKGCCWLGLPAVELARVVAAVEGGEVWIKRAVMAQLIEAMQPPMPLPVESAAQPVPALGGSHLTQRERQIAMLVCAGQANKQIGRELGISERTVKAHLTEIFRKLGISDRLMLAIQLNGPRQAVPVTTTHALHSTV